MGLNAFGLPISLLMIAKIFVLHLNIIIKSEVWIISYCCYIELCPLCVLYVFLRSFPSPTYFKNTGLIPRIKTPCYWYKDSKYKPEKVVRPSQVSNGESYTHKTAVLHLLHWTCSILDLHSQLAYPTGCLRICKWLPLRCLVRGLNICVLYFGSLLENLILNYSVASKFGTADSFVFVCIQIYLCIFLMH